VSDNHSDVSCPDVYRVLSFSNSLDSRPGGGLMNVAKWSGTTPGWHIRRGGDVDHARDGDGSIRWCC
jgi:hypothetical protein